MTTLETDPTVRAARFLRETCAMFRVDPPSVEDVQEYASVAFDVTDTPIDPCTWLDAFIDEREAAAGDRAVALYARLKHLPSGMAQTVFECTEDARFASPCGPPPRVIVLYCGTVIVSDNQGDTWTFDPNPPPRRPLRWLADLWLGR